MSSPLRTLGLFTPQPRDFEHINFDAAAAENAGLIITAICLGIILASLYSFYVNRVPGGVVRALIAAEALSPESAKTAAELGLSRIMTFELLRNTTLRRLLRYVGDEPNEEGVCTPRDLNARYYLPEEVRDRAAIRFDKRGSSAMGLIITATLAFALGLLMAKCLPWLLGMIDKIL